MGFAKSSTHPTDYDAGRCARRNERIWRTASGTLSFGSFHGNRLTSAFGASIALSIALPIPSPVTAYVVPPASPMTANPGRPSMDPVRPVRSGAPRDMSNELEAVKRGYAFVQMNERGHFFSEGNYDILGAPLSDGDDAFTWIARQPWSNGKVGTIGCSSTAEWQLAVAALGNPAYAAMVPQGFGAGVGRVGPYYEQGNWYRGGAFQMLFAAWAVIGLVVYYLYGYRKSHVARGLVELPELAADAPHTAVPPMPGAPAPGERH